MRHAITATVLCSLLGGACGSPLPPESPALSAVALRDGRHYRFFYELDGRARAIVFTNGSTETSYAIQWQGDVVDAIVATSSSGAPRGSWRYHYRSDGQISEVDFGNRRWRHDFADDRLAGSVSEWQDPDGTIFEAPRHEFEYEGSQLVVRCRHERGRRTCRRIEWDAGLPHTVSGGHIQLTFDPHDRIYSSDGARPWFPDYDDTGRITEVRPLGTRFEYERRPARSGLRIVVPDAPLELISFDGRITPQPYPFHLVLHEEGVQPW